MKKDPRMEIKGPARWQPHCTIYWMITAMKNATGKSLSSMRFSTCNSVLDCLKKCCLLMLILIERLNKYPSIIFDI